MEAIDRFFEEVAFVEYGFAGDRGTRLAEMASLGYNDIAADRNVVATIMACEALLQEQAAGRPGGVAMVNPGRDGLFLLSPGRPEVCLYSNRV